MHTMTSHGLGRLTGSKRVLWVVNRGFELYTTHLMFLIWNGRQWRILGRGKNANCVNAS